jgi:YidC/Oxa1 family membrane protein insertase
MNFGFGKDWQELGKFEKLTDEARSIVFYAENKASINHFRLLISELTEEKNLQICYVTSVKNDPMLSSKNKNIFAFYIGDGTARTKFFLTLKAKILIMDMPDLETFHIKRSKVYPVHYVYIFHSMFSIHSYLRKGAIDNYDTIFCVGEHHKKEIRETEKVYRLKPKKLITYGFGRLDTLLHEKQKFSQTNTDNDKLIIIAPSYGKDNLLEVCGVELLEILLKSDFRVLLRPHFRTLRDSKKIIKTIEEKFGNNPNFILEEGIISPEKFHNSKCMISDWSGISFEYAFTFERPVIFIDVPKKILNPDSGDISLEPIEISIRDKIGYVVSPKNLEKIPEVIENIDGDSSTNERIIKIRSETIYNLGKSAKIGAEAIEKICMELN